MINWRDSFIPRQARARPLAAFCIAFLAGCIAAYRASIPMELCALLSGAAGLVLLWRVVNHRRMLAAALLLGAGLGMLRMTAALTSFPEVETRYSVPMVGRVMTEPFVKPETGRLIFKYRIDTAEGVSDGRVVRLYLRGDEAALSEIDYGQTLAVTGHIWATDPVTNPFEFDFAEWLHRNGMAAIATARIEQVEVLSQTRDVQSVLIDARRAMRARIDALFPKSAPLVRALMLGDRSMVGDELRSAMSATGTAHLISISGLHVTVLAMAFSLLLGCFMPRRWANLATLVPLLAYGALIGFRAPFVRAMVMFAVFSFAPIAGMPSDAVTRLTLAMLIWLVIHPLSLGDSGFILSFAASAGIILLMPPILRLFGLDRLTQARVGWNPRRRLPWRIAVYFATLLCASLAAQLATLPAVVSLFGCQSVVSLPFNLIGVPLCMAGYILALISLAVSTAIPPLGQWLAAGADELLRWLVSIAQLSRALPVTSVHIGRYPELLVLIHCGLVLAASDLCAVRDRIRRLLPLGLIALAGISSLICWLGAWPFSVCVLDAGQANCAILTTRGHTYVFDVGDTYSPAADYLNATCLHLDGVFLSHPHEDHAGGLSDLLTAFRPDVIYVPVGWYDCEGTADSITEGIERAKALSIPIVEICDGDTIELSDDAILTVYNPDGSGVPDDINDLSLVLHAACEDHSTLFTGDLTMNGEPETLPECDILHVPHHGSDNATSYELLLQTMPEYAVISVVADTLSHPGEDALERIEASGAALMRTDQLGAIKLTLHGDEWRVKTFLEASDELE